MNRDGPEVRAIDRQAMVPKQPGRSIHARRFEYAAAPTKPIEGVVRDKDTGRPIAGLTLRGMVYEEHSSIGLAPGVEATTDAQGHYRLTGLPKGPAYRLFVEPGEGQPYPRATFRVPAGSPALEPVTFDIALKRGILVRGRVTDKATGRPVPGYVTRLHLPRQSARRRVPRLRGERPGLRLHRGRRPVRGRRPAGPRRHRLPLRDAPLPGRRRRRGDQGV